jgi:hypothetical protein
MVLPVELTGGQFDTSQLGSALTGSRKPVDQFVELQYAKRKLISEQFLPHRKDCYEILLSLDERAIDVHC